MDSQIRIPFTTLLKIAAFAVLLVAIVSLFKLVLLLFLGLLLAGAMLPMVNKLRQKRVPDMITITGVVMIMVGIVAAVAIYIIPEMFTQVTAFVKDFPKIQSSVLSHIPRESPFYQLGKQLVQNSKNLGSEQILSEALFVANNAFEGLSEFFLVLIFCVYILSDRNRAYKWMKDFFQESTRKKIDQTMEETSEIVIGYVTGQFVTSVLAAIYTYAALSFLNVPLALTLAFFAGIFDVLPVLGFFLAVIPALFMALTVSPATAAFTLGVYILYHAIENYIIIPWIYGNRMKVSSLVVLLSLLAAGLLGGALPAIVILPIVASYPIIEKIWLQPYLGRRVVNKHEEEIPPEYIA